MRSIVSKCISSYTSIRREVRFIVLFFLWPFAMLFMRVLVKASEGHHHVLVALLGAILEILLCVIFAVVAVLFMTEWYAQAGLRIKNVIVFNVVALMGVGWIVLGIGVVSEFFYNLIFKV